MHITFEPLAESHFPLLLQWLETPHVKAWYDQDIKWTKELIAEKYGPYVKGYKIQDGEAKKLQAFIICCDAKPVGYIQLYNFYEFPRDTPLEGLPKSLAALDLFIGDPNYVGKNIGSQAMRVFMQQYSDPFFEYTFIDPDVNNIAAIKAYTKAGFEQFKVNATDIWMLRKSNT